MMDLEVHLPEKITRNGTPNFGHPNGSANQGLVSTPWLISAITNILSAA
jgi:hypothetical protein